MEHPQQYVPHSNTTMPLSRSASQAVSPTVQQLAKQVQGVNTPNNKYMDVNSVIRSQLLTSPSSGGVRSNLSTAKMPPCGLTQKKIIIAPPSNLMGKRQPSPCRYASPETGRSSSVISAANHSPGAARADTPRMGARHPLFVPFLVKKKAEPSTDSSLQQQGRMQVAAPLRGSSNFFSNEGSTEMLIRSTQKSPISNLADREAHREPSPFHVRHQQHPNGRGVMQPESRISNMEKNDGKATGSLWSNFKNSLGLLNRKSKANSEQNNCQKTSVLTDLRASVSTNQRVLTEKESKGETTAKTARTHFLEGNVSMRSESHPSYDDTKAPSRLSVNQRVRQPIQEQVALSTTTGAAAPETTTKKSDTMQRVLSSQGLDTAASLPVVQNTKACPNNSSQDSLSLHCKGKRSFRAFAITDSDSDTSSRGSKPDKGLKLGELLGVMEGKLNQPVDIGSTLPSDAEFNNGLLPSPGKKEGDVVAEEQPSDVNDMLRQSLASNNTEAPDAELTTAEKTVLERVKSTSQQKSSLPQKLSHTKDMDLGSVNRSSFFALCGNGVSPTEQNKSKEGGQENKHKVKKGKEQLSNGCSEKADSQAQQKIGSPRSSMRSSQSANAEVTLNAPAVIGNKKEKNSKNNGKDDFEILQQNSKINNAADTALLNVAGDEQDNQYTKSLKEGVFDIRQRKSRCRSFSLHSEIFHTTDVYKLYKELKRQQSRLRKERFPFFYNYGSEPDNCCYSHSGEKKSQTTSAKKCLPKPWLTSSPNPGPLPFPSPLRRPLGYINFGGGRRGCIACDRNTNDGVSKDIYVGDTKCTPYISSVLPPEKLSSSVRALFSPHCCPLQTPRRQSESFNNLHVHPYEVVSFLVSPKPDGQRKQKTFSVNDSRSVILPYGDNAHDLSGGYNDMRRATSSTPRSSCDIYNAGVESSYSVSKERPSHTLASKWRDKSPMFDFLGQNQTVRHFRRCCSDGDISRARLKTTPVNNIGTRVVSPRLSNTTKANDNMSLVARAVGGRIPIPIVDLRRDFKPQLCTLLQGSQGSVSPQRSRRKRCEANSRSSERHMSSSRGGTELKSKEKTRCSSSLRVAVEKPSCLAGKLYSSFEIKDPGRLSAWALGPERRELSANSLAARRRIIQKKHFCVENGVLSLSGDKHDNGVCNNSSSSNRCGYKNATNNDGNAGVGSTILVEEVRLDEHRRPYVLIREVPCGAAAVAAQMSSAQRLAKPRRPVFVPTE